MTLLVYVAGASPYRHAPTNMVKLAWVKSGEPMAWVMRDMELAQRFEDVERKTGGRKGALSAWFNEGFQDGTRAWKMSMGKLS